MGKITSLTNGYFHSIIYLFFSIPIVNEAYLYNLYLSKMFHK